MNATDLTTVSTAAGSHAITISDRWEPGKGILSSLSPTGNVEAGYSRQEVTGSAADYHAATIAARAEYAAAIGAHKGALSRLIRRLEGAGRMAALQEGTDAKVSAS